MPYTEERRAPKVDFAWREKKKDEEIEIGMELTFSLSMNERSPSFSPTKRRMINRRQVKKYENFPEIRGGGKVENRQLLRRMRYRRGLFFWGGKFTKILLIKRIRTV